MIKKRTATYMAFAESNRKSVALGATVIPAIVENKIEKKSKRGTTYFLLVVQTLNRTPVTLSVQSDEDAAASEVTVAPTSTLIVTTFDRVGVAAVDRSSLVKLPLVAEAYMDRVSYKADQVLIEAGSQYITTPLYKKLVAGSALADIPTKDNIDPATFPTDTDTKYIKRAFLVPLSVDTGAFDDVELLVPFEDPKRFWGKKKDDETVYASVNVETGPDKVQNCMSVMYQTPAGARFMFKMAYMPDVWRCFQVSDVGKWAQVAGRMMSNAAGWFAYGSSRLDNIMSMRANADDDGIDFEADTTSAATDIVTTTGFVSNMALDLAGTVARAGVPLSFEYVSTHFGDAYSYSPIEAPAATGWRAKLAAAAPAVFNVTELIDDVRIPFLREAKDTVKYYGIFAIGDDRVYEAENGEVEAVENGTPPVAVFAVKEN